jgi:hypothetical protein
MRIFGLSVHGKLKALSCFSALAALALCSGVAQAALLTYDLRVANTQAGGTTKVDAHNAQVSAVGDVVNLELYAVTHNGDGDQTNDGFLTGQGSFVGSLNGGNPRLAGALRGAGTSTSVNLLNNVSPFKSTGATSGAPSDYEGDGIIDDVGLNSTGNGAVNDWFLATAGSSSQPGTEMVAGDLSQLIGKTTFTVSAIGPSQSVLADFIPRLLLTGTAIVQNMHLGTSDNADFALRGDNQGIAHLGSIISAKVIPEPGSVVMLGLGAVGLLLWRARRSRATT